MSEKNIAMPVLAEPDETAGFRGFSSRAAYGTPLTRVILTVGLLLFFALVWRIGPGDIGQLLWKANWALPFVLMPYTLVIGCEALGWWFAFPSGHVMRFNDLLRFTIAIKAIQFLTPSIIQAGEFMKVHLLRQNRVNVDVGVASVVVAKTAIMSAEFLYIGLGLSLTLRYVAVEPILAWSVTLGIIVMGLCIVGIFLWQRNGMFRPVIWMGRHIRLLTSFVERHEKVLSSTESIVREYLEEKRRFAWSCLWFFMGWTAGIVEVWVLLHVLGLPSDLGSALVVQVWSVIVTRLTTFIPGNLGAQEAGTVMTFSFLGLSPESAMAFAVLRRLRQVGWTAVSLGYLTKLSRD